MKPYPAATLTRERRIFNYRLSRCRRVIENCFGIAAARFRILRRPIIAKVQLVTRITQSIVALHNYLMADSNAKRSSNYCPVGFADTQDVRNGDWRKEIQGDTNFLPN